MVSLVLHRSKRRDPRLGSNSYRQAYMAFVFSETRSAILLSYSLTVFACLLEILVSSSVLEFLKSTGSGSHEGLSAGTIVKLSDLTRSDSPKLNDFV